MKNSTKAKTKPQAKAQTQEEFNVLDNAYLKAFIGLVIFVISMFGFARVTNIVENVIMSYDINSNIDYKVFLFENDYLPYEYMQEGKAYISNLVAKVRADFDYTIKTSDKFDSEYEYDIYAKAIVAHETSGKELWTDRIDLVNNVKIDVEDKKNAIDRNEIKIKDSVEIPYNLFNTKVKAFKNQHNIPIKAFIDVELVIVDKVTKKQVATTGLSMDLYEDIFEVSEVKTGEYTENITEEEVPNKILIFVIFCIMFTSGLYTLFMIYLIIDYSLSKKTYYAKAIYTILKNYGDIVAEVVKPIELDNLKVIDVKNFDQMLDVEEELRIPIMFFETIKGKEGWFVLVHNDLAYRYILKDKVRGK